MAPKKASKNAKDVKVKKADWVTMPEEPVAVSSPSQSLEHSIKRLGQQFNLLTLVLVALFIFQGYSFYQLKALEKNGVVAGAEQESPLSQEKLFSYAKELKLNEGDFKTCFESEEAKNIVSADAKYAAEMGVQGTPGFFINGKFLGGAFPIESFREIIDKELDGTGSELCEGYSEDMQQYCSDPENAAFKPAKVQVTVGKAPISGSRTAPVIIVEFADFECPFCARAYDTVNQIKSEYGDKVAIAYKHLPLSFHPNAEPAARASVCADKQGKFWEYHDKLFEVQSQ